MSFLQMAKPSPFILQCRHNKALSNTGGRNNINIGIQIKYLDTKIEVIFCRQITTWGKQTTIWYSHF